MPRTFAPSNAKTSAGVREWVLWVLLFSVLCLAPAVLGLGAGWSAAQPYQAAQVSSESRNWPRIQPFDRTYSFGRPVDMYLHLPLLAVTGKPAYVLECASPESERARAAGFHASQEFECRLSLPGAKTPAEAQLLARPAEAAPRNAFTWNQLNGDCFRYPDYGAQRIFQLRNLRLVLILSNVRFGPETRIGNRVYKHSLQGFSLRLQGFFDPIATSEFPVPSRYEPPKTLASDATGQLDCKVPVLRSTAAGR
jgi:hypothetical protein